MELYFPIRFPCPIIVTYARAALDTTERIPIRIKLITVLTCHTTGIYRRRAIIFKSVASRGSIKSHSRDDGEDGSNDIASKEALHPGTNYEVEVEITVKVTRKRMPTS